MNFKASLRTLIDAVDAGGSKNSVRIALGHFARTNSFHYFAFVHFADDRMIKMSNYPREWQTRYVDNQYSRIDPIVTTARREMKPFVWSANPRSGRKWTERESELFREAKEFGICSGLTIPIQTAFGTSAMLTVTNDASRQGLESCEEAALAATAVTFLHLRLRLIDPAVAPDRITPLSAQEAACLQWCAHGKHMSEIAQILAVRVRTVQFHLDNARDKLGAVSLPHAVRLAFHRKLIR